MNIFTVFFFIILCVFHLPAFSFEGQNNSMNDIGWREHPMVLDVCLKEIMVRRISLHEETDAISEKLREAKDRKKALSKHVDHIRHVVMKGHVLNYVADEPIDLSQNTCNEFLDKATADPDIRIAAIDNAFDSFFSFTMKMMDYNVVQDSMRRGESMEDGAIDDLIRRGESMEDGMGDDEKRLPPVLEFQDVSKQPRYRI